MNFLQLVNSGKQEMGISGAELTTVVGATKELKRLVDWISQAWIDVQNERTDWEFARKDFLFNTVAGQHQYHVGSGLDINLSDFKRWRNYSFKAYQQSAGVGTEILLTQYMDYGEFREFYLTGSRRLVTGRPLYITVAPDKSLFLGFTPNDVYVVSGEYYRKAQVLTADADEPIMPEDYHKAIVYRAMVKYGYFELAQEQLAAAKEEYKQIMYRLVSDQTPMIQMGGSLI
jgi:hypothetical protein